MFTRAWYHTERHYLCTLVEVDHIGCIELGYLFPTSASCCFKPAPTPFQITCLSPYWFHFFAGQSVISIIIYYTYHSKTPKPRVWSLRSPLTLCFIEKKQIAWCAVGAACFMIRKASKNTKQRNIKSLNQMDWSQKTELDVYNQWTSINLKPYRYFVRPRMAWYAALLWVAEDVYALCLTF